MWLPMGAAGLVVIAALLNALACQEPVPGLHGGRREPWRAPPREAARRGHPVRKSTASQGSELVADEELLEEARLLAERPSEHL